MQFCRNELGNFIYLGIAYAHNPSYVTDDCPGKHGSKGDDLGNIVSSVFLGNVVNDFLPALIAEININVR